MKHLFVLHGDILVCCGFGGFFLGLQYNNRTFNIRKVSTNESCLNTDPLIIIVHGSMWVCLLLFYRVIMDK